MQVDGVSLAAVTEPAARVRSIVLDEVNGDGEHCVRRCRRQAREKGVHQERTSRITSRALFDDMDRSTTRLKR